MLENILSLVKNTKFQIGFGVLVVAFVVGWAFTSDQEAETVVTEEASTGPVEVELEKHDVTPTDENAQEDSKQEEEANQEANVTNNNSN